MIDPATKARLDRLYDLVLEFRYGVERLRMDKKRLGAAWGISAGHEKLEQAILRGEGDIDVLVWAIQALGGKVETLTTEQVEARLRQRLLMVED